MAEVPMEAQGQESEEGQGAGEFEKLASNVLKGMELLGGGLQKMGAADEILSGLKGCMDQFQSVVEAVMSGGVQGGGEPAPQGPKAVPVKSVQGQPVGPQG